METIQREASQRRGNFAIVYDSRHLRELENNESII